MFFFISICDGFFAEILLCTYFFLTDFAWRDNVCSVTLHYSCFYIVCKLYIKNMNDFFFECFVFDREQYFNTLVKVSRHPVSTSHIDLLKAIVVKIEYSAVFKEITYDRTDGDIIAYSFYSCFKTAYSTDDKVDNPVSLYAATKKSDELLAHAYSKLYDIPSTGLRFFTVYGPAGRPDMAYFGFTNKLRAGETIKIFNYGNCRRDFTYVDDIVEGILRVMQGAPSKQTGEDGLPVPPYAVYNIGNGHPENLLEFVTILQEELLRAKVLPADYDFESHKELVPMQPGDVPVTYADTAALERDFGYKPSTPLREGLRRFAEWYKPFYLDDSDK